jgi:hypothetical protein
MGKPMIKGPESLEQDELIAVIIGKGPHWRKQQIYKTGSAHILFQKIIDKEK